jgi:hypothetical protein
MNRLVPFAPALLLGGCIIYDHTGDCKRGDCSVWVDTGGLSLTDTGSAAPEPTFTLTPSEASAGEEFIASLTAENFDVSTVESVEVFGNASVTSQVVREDELLLTVEVSAAAQAGDTVDLLLHVGNDAIFAEAVLSVVESADPADDGSGSSGSDGSGDCQ